MNQDQATTVASFIVTILGNRLLSTYPLHVNDSIKFELSEEPIPETSLTFKKMFLGALNFFALVEEKELYVLVNLCMQGSEDAAATYIMNQYLMVPNDKFISETEFTISGVFPDQQLDLELSYGNTRFLCNSSLLSNNCTYINDRNVTDILEKLAGLRKHVNAH